MNRTLVSLICVFALLGGTTHALAAEQPAAQPSAAEAEAEGFGAAGAYIEVGGVYAIENFDAHDNAASMDGDNLDKGSRVNSYDNSGGYQLRDGYRITPWVAVEGEWEHAIDFQDSVEASIYNLMVNGKFYFYRFL